MIRDSILYKAKFIFVIIFIVLVNSIIVFGKSDSKIISEDLLKISEPRSSIVISGSMPKLTKHSNVEFQNGLNDKIKIYYNEIIETSSNSKYIKKLHFVYFTTDNPNRNTQSIVIQATITSSVTRTSLRAFTFDDAIGKEISLTDDKCLGVNGIAIAGDAIKNTIVNEPNKYNVTFKKITNNKDFYIDDNNKIFIIYSDYKFELNLNNFATVTIGINNYESKSPNTIEMIPLRQVCSPLGYRLIWNDKYKTVGLHKGKESISFMIGKNEYTKDNISKKLETEPIINNGETLVPISFFNKILNLYYTINPDDSIVFSSYY